MSSNVMRVNLRVPGYAKGGDVLPFSARGVTFKVKIPNGYRPGQYFTVRVPLGGHEKKQAPISNVEKCQDISFNLQPNIVIGSDEFFKEVRSCSDWCNPKRLCCPVVQFAGPGHDIQITHNCCCLPCCFNFSIWGRKNGQTNQTNWSEIGRLLPASCSDQNCTAVVCPCCYRGPMVRAKFVDKKGQTKYMMKSNVECCQYLCLCLNICNPCYRCYRFCCLDQQYTTYTQRIYGADLNDNTVKANLVYVKRMVVPCVPDETIQLKVEPVQGASISKDHLVLLSMYPALVSGYTSAEFCCPLHLPGGMMSSMPTPSGIPQVNHANNIESEAMNIKEALNRRKKAYQVMN